LLALIIVDKYSYSFIMPVIDIFCLQGIQIVAQQCQLMAESINGKIANVSVTQIVCQAEQLA